MGYRGRLEAPVLSLPLALIALVGLQTAYATDSLEVESKDKPELSPIAAPALAPEESPGEPPPAPAEPPMEPPAAPSMLTEPSLALLPPPAFEPLWTYGFELGVAIRQMPPGEIPTGVAPRLDLMVVQVRRALPGPPPFEPFPDRLDGQVDLLHLWATSSSTRRPRLPVCAYAVWLRPLNERRDLSLSAGLYTEWGADIYLFEEQLRRSAGLTLAPAARVGFERSRRRREASGAGVYLRVAYGVSFAREPDHLPVTRYGLVGLEHSWYRGRGSAP